MADIEELSERLHNVVNLHDLKGIMEPLNSEERKKATNTKIPSMTPLHLAMFIGNFDMLKYLIEDCSGDVTLESSEGETILDIGIHFSILAENPPVLKYLIERGADIHKKNDNGETYLIRSVKYPKICEILIDNGIDMFAVDNDNHTAIEYAAFKMAHDTVDLLILKGSGKKNIPHEVARQIAYCATFMGNARLLEFAFKKGLDLKILNDTSTDSRDFFRLFNCYPDIIRVLINNGIDVTRKDEHQTSVLHHLAQFVYGSATIRMAMHYERNEAEKKKYLKSTADMFSETIKLLTAAGIDINATDFMRKTPLHFAANDGHIEFVECLLDCGADPSLKDNAGMSAIHCAVYMNKIDLFNYLFDLKSIPMSHKIEAVEMRAVKPLKEFDFEGFKKFYTEALELRQTNNILEKEETHLNNLFGLNEPANEEEIMELKESKGDMLKISCMITARIHGIGHAVSRRTIMKYISSHEFHSDDRDALVAIQVGLVNLNSISADPLVYPLEFFEPTKEILLCHFKMDERYLLFDLIDTKLEHFLDMLKIYNDNLHDMINVTKCVSIALYALYRLMGKGTTDEHFIKCRDHLYALLEIYMSFLEREKDAKQLILHDFFKYVFKDYVFDNNSEQQIHHIVEEIVLNFMFHVFVRDDDGCTALHHLLMYTDNGRYSGMINISIMQEVVETLLRTGIHLDAVSKSGACIHRMLNRQGYDLGEHSITPLKCMAAQVVMRNNFKVTEGEIPTDLVSFTMKHGFNEEYEKQLPVLSYDSSGYWKYNLDKLPYSDDYDESDMDMESD